MRWLPTCVALALGLLLVRPGAAQEVPEPLITGVAVAGDRVYLVDHRPFPGYLRVLSVADPRRPTQLAAGELTSCGGPGLAGVSRGVAEVLCTYTGYAVDARVLTDPLPTAQFNAPVFPERDAVAGDRLYVTSSYGPSGTLALRVLDLADPARPVSAGGVELTDVHPAGHSLAGTATHAFVAWRRGTATELVVVDATDPADPRVVARTPLPGSAVPGAAATDGRWLYVAVGEEIVVVDVSDPAAPRVMGTAATPGLTAFWLRLAAGRLYAAGRSALLVLDTADPALPAVRGRYDLGVRELYDLAAEGRYVYLALGTGGLEVVDVADPDRPVPVGRYGNLRMRLPLVPQRAEA
jgi:hypothetical protein